MVERPVHWTHFGGGEEEDAVRAAVARCPQHISVDLRGMVLNKKIIAHYKSKPVDVFVHLSHLEGGVAIAIQEAASFGIPVIATDSGGVREIMRPGTGVLLPRMATAREVAEQLNGFKDGPMYTVEFREGVRRTWNENFNAQVTFHRFVDRILA